MSENEGPPILMSDEWQRFNDTTTQGNAAAEHSQTPRAEAEEYEHVQAVPIGGTPPPASPQGEGNEPKFTKSEVAEHSDGPPPDPIQEDLNIIRSELTSLRQESDRLNKTIDRLHAENVQLRRGENAQLLDPIFRDLVKLADDWNVMAAAWDSKGEATADEVARKFRDVADDANLILQRYGVDAYQPEVGEPVERKLHRVVGTVPATSTANANTVVGVRRSGYFQGDRVIRFAEVVAAK